MKIILEVKNGSSISGDAIMLSRYGEVYPAIDNLYHPNPGSKEDEYPEIERTIDWLYQHDISGIKKSLDQWIKIRVAHTISEDGLDDFDDIVKEVMYSDIYDPCENTLNSIKDAIEDFRISKDLLLEYSDKSELPFSEKIAVYLNEKFLRVRAGGKLNPEGTDSIYFRISSHGYDWHRTIVEFLWDVFKSPDQMPKRIWIGHDAETNPPEVTLFDGSPNDLLENEDVKVFEELKSSIREGLPSQMNNDRKCFLMNKRFLCNYKGKYKSFR